jgi:hypothetical protein
MSFRQFGGLQYASKHNAVASNYNTSNNLLVTQNVGQSNSYINFLSDISGNITLYGDLDISGNLNVGGDVDISGNLHVQKDIDCSGNVTADYMFLSSQNNYTLNPWGVVPKKYIDDRVEGLIPLAACQCATTAFVNLSTAPSTIDGYTVQTGDRVLVNYQSNSSPNVANTANGIYVVNLTTSPYWTYAADWTGDTYRCTVNVLSGLQNGNKQFIQIQEPGIVSTNTILFEIFSSSDEAGRGLSYDVSSNALYLNVDTSLNFVNYLDNSAGPDNAGTLNLGTVTNTINIGSSTSQTSVLVPDSIYTALENQTGFQIETGKSSGDNYLYFGASKNQNYSFIQSVREGVGSRPLLLNARGGNVGIGTSTPSFRLDVSGNLRTTADALINGLTVGRGTGSVSTNTALGFESLLSNSGNGNDNTAVGFQSMRGNTTGDFNTGVGVSSLLNNTSGFSNTAVGYESVRTNTNGQCNTGVGFQSLSGVTSGNSNTSVGYQALQINGGNATGNTALGHQALNNIASGNFNVALGFETLQNITGNGSNNTALGYQACRTLFSTSSNNTFLGATSNVSSTTRIFNDSTAIGYGAIIDASNQIVLGRATEKVKIPGSYVGIGGNYNPGGTYALDVSGNVNATSYKSSSDYRIKENVTPLDIKFIVDNLNPVTYLNKNLGKQDFGLIAHELQEIYPELVTGEKDGEQLQSVNYIGLIPILIKEVKELKKEIILVKTELNELKNK